jgi:hypothetical protein
LSEAGREREILSPGAGKSAIHLVSQVSS